MLLSANGQNIYPEEIESQLNNLPYIAESLVIMRDTKLIAMVWPDIPAMKENNIPEKRLKEIMEENKGLLNQSVAQYERISAIEIVDMEFEKTPKKTIKRFLYE